MSLRRAFIGILFAVLPIIFLTGAARAEKNPPTRPIDLNLANLKELQELPGVGAVTAQRIIDMRQKSGRFHRVEDLLAIRGISQKKLDAMRRYVTVSSPSPSALPPHKVVPPTKKGNT